MRTHKATTAAVFTSCLVLILAGCGTPDDNDNETQNATPAASPTAPQEPTDTAPAETEDPGAAPTSTAEPNNGQPEEIEDPPDADYGTEEQRNPDYPSAADADGLFPSDARLAAHDDFERVVLDFEGTGTPGWRVRYVEEAIANDSGQEIDLDGEFILKIDASGLVPPVTDGQINVEEMATGFYDTNQTDLIQDLYVSGVFEGWSSTLIGLDGQASFRVFTLTEPTRLVVDIQADDT